MICRGYLGELLSPDGWVARLLRIVSIFLKWRPLSLRGLIGRRGAGGFGWLLKGWVVLRCLGLSLTANLNSVGSLGVGSVATRAVVGVPADVEPWPMVRPPVGVVVGRHRGRTVGRVLADDQQRLRGSFGPAQSALRLGGAEHFLQQRRGRLPAGSIQSVNVVRDGHLQLRVDLGSKGLNVLEAVRHILDGLGLGQVVLAGNQLVRLGHGEAGAGWQQILLSLLGVVARPQWGKQRAGSVQQVQVSRQESSLSWVGLSAERKCVLFLPFNLTKITELLKVKRFVIHYNIGPDSNHYRSQCKVHSDIHYAERIIRTSSLAPDLI